MQCANSDFKPSSMRFVHFIVAKSNVYHLHWRYCSFGFLVNVHRSWCMGLLCETWLVKCVQYNIGWLKPTNWDWKKNYLENKMGGKLQNELVDMYKNVEMTTLQNWWWHIKRFHYKVGYNDPRLCFKVQLHLRKMNQHRCPCFFYKFHNYCGLCCMMMGKKLVVLKHKLDHICHKSFFCYTLKPI